MLSRRPYYSTFQSDSGGEYLFDAATGTVMPTNDLMRQAIRLCATTPVEEVRQKLYTLYPQDEVDGMVNFVQRWDKNFGGLYRTDESVTTSKDGSPHVTGRMGSDNALRIGASNRYSLNVLGGDGCGPQDQMQGTGAATAAEVERFLRDSGLPFQMILNLTEDCNFRCQYCYLTEVYQFTRNRTFKKMSIEVGLRALDWFFNLLAPVARKIPGKKAAISFYGGEPLLMYKKLALFVSYARAHSPVPLSFNVTSNASLLTDEMIDFLADNNVVVAFSLDGRKEDHDRNRKFPNGTGTFDVVFGNIQRFKKRHPKYAHLGLSCVLDYKTDLRANMRFFEENDLPPILFLTRVLDLNTDYYKRFTEDDKSRFLQEANGMFADYIALKKQGKYVPKYMRAFCEMLLASVVIRPRREDPRPRLAPWTGTCIPGMKVSVRTDGTLDMCERVNTNFSIGHIDTGLNYGAIAKILNLYNAALKGGCAACAFNNTCSLCFAQCNQECSFCRPGTWCADWRQTYTNALSMVYSILEHEPSAFDDFDVVSAEAAEKFLFRL
jgi:uncharacterized protein